MQALTITSLCGNGWHQIDRAPIRLHEASKPQSVNLLGLFPFLSAVTVIIFQPPSPDLADRDQMVTG